MSRKENADKDSLSSSDNASPSPASKKVAVIEAQCAGPLPPPEAFQRYEEILPGAAERILKMAEKQAEHRQRLEEKIVNAEIRDARLGLIFGFLIGLTTCRRSYLCTSRSSFAWYFSQFVGINESSRSFYLRLAPKKAA